MTSKLIIFTTMVFLGTSCGYFNDKPWGPESTSLSESMSLAGEINGTPFIPKFGYLTAYPNENLPLPKRRLAHHVDLVLMDAGSEDELNCDKTTGLGVNHHPSLNNTGRSLIFRQLTNDYFRWEKWVFNFYQPSALMFKDGTAEEVSLAPADENSGSLIIIWAADSVNKLMSISIGMGGNFNSLESTPENFAIGIPETRINIKYCDEGVYWPKWN